MPGQVPAKIKNSRYRAAMTMQQSIAHEVRSRENWQRTNCSSSGRLRNEADAPDVDARVVLSEPSVGEFIRRTVKGSRG
jgi:hypothetical protein